MLFKKGAAYGVIFGLNVKMPQPEILGLGLCNCSCYY